MSPSVVQDILKMIDELSDTDRDFLQRQLRQREETQWRQEAEVARREAKARGIDQTAIDEAVRNVRYGS